jgi:acyl dehydratase
MTSPTLTGASNYFEDFQVGQVLRHARGKTIGEIDNTMFAHLVMNTAQGHFNEHAMNKGAFGQRVYFGGLTASMIIGLAAQDTAENALAELSVTGIRLKAMVFHGDTLYAYTEVLDKRDADRTDAGIVVFRHLGFNQKDEQVFDGQRTVLIRRRLAGLKA